MRESNTEPSNGVLISLGIISVVLGIFFWLTVVQSLEEKNPSEEAPSIISEFFDYWIVNSNSLDDAVDKFVVPASEGEPDESVSSFLDGRNALSFEYVIFNRKPVPISYAITFACRGYVELVFTQEDGAPDYPRVGMWYELTEDGNKIADYTLARLQPFSRLHEEYDKQWNN